MYTWDVSARVCFMATRRCYAYRIIHTTTHLYDIKYTGVSSSRLYIFTVRRDEICACACAYVQDLELVFTLKNCSMHNQTGIQCASGFVLCSIRSINIR